METEISKIENDEDTENLEECTSSSIQKIESTMTSAIKIYKNEIKGEKKNISIGSEKSAEFISPNSKTNGKEIRIVDDVKVSHKETSELIESISNGPISSKSGSNRSHTPSKGSTVEQNRAELLAVYTDGSALLVRCKAALHIYRTKTFFRPNIPFIKGINAAINQIEGGLNKMGQLFSSQPNEPSDKGSLTADPPITPPASEAGTDTANDSSYTTHDISASSTGVLTSGATAATNGVAEEYSNVNNDRRLSLDTSDVKIIDGSANVSSNGTIKKRSSSQITKKTEKINKKRERESTEPLVAVKRPRRSLLSEFLTNKGVHKKAHESNEDDANNNNEDGEEKKDEEFEVEKILDYNKVKGNCVYQVRWRNYGPSDDTWEPLMNLTGCEEILLSFIRSRLVERSRVKQSEDLKTLLLPCEEQVRPLLRAGFLAQMSAPRQQDVGAMLPMLLAGKYKVKEMPELEGDIDRLVAIKDCLSDRYQRQFNDLKQQLVLRECKQQRERQEAELRRWQREMSRICSAPAPLSVVNEVDLSLPPKDFVYINEYIPSKGIIIPKDPLVGCECTDCGNSQNTCCAKQMSSYFAYNKYGRLKVSLGTAIYECNKLCGCAKSGTCHNRVVQRGRTVQLTIFRTSNNRGWGVKAGELIRAGSFVTEYVGEVISSEEAERRGQIYDARGCTYLFDLDYNKGDLNPYTVDAAKYGNVSHFINHSCDPSLVVFNVWVNCLDPDMPKLALFATREIKKGEEITFDYNSPSSRPQNPTLAPDEENGESRLLHEDSPIRLQKDIGSLDMSCKTPKRGINHGKTVCHCGAANCRKYFF